MIELSARVFGRRILKMDIQYIISNFQFLKYQGLLEQRLIPAYLHAENFNNIVFNDLKAAFDFCDRKILLEKYPLPIRDESQQNNPFTIFRGCIGKDFRHGMSWTTDLYQAIKYSKRNNWFHWYGDNMRQQHSVWCSLVEKHEIYCYLNHYEPEFIVCPKNYWKIEIPQNFFSMKQ